MEDKQSKPKPKSDSKGKGGPPTAAPPPPPSPGMNMGAPPPPPMPGEGVDPFAAMQGQISPTPTAPNMPMMGDMMGGGAPMMPPPGTAAPSPYSFPMAPGNMGEPDADDNPMLRQLLSGGGGMPGAGINSPALNQGPMVQDPGDPYAILPGESQYATAGAGPEDPNMGLQQMLTLLMLAQAGVGGGAAMPVKSSSGLVPDPASNIMYGMDFSNGGGPGFGMY
jgi:hypothetical protein